MGNRRKLGMSALAILRAISEGRPYGFEIMDSTGLAGGTVYPALARLESDRLVTSHWEDPSIAQREKRPPRRYYAITSAGRTRLTEELAWIGAVAPGAKGA